MIAFLKSILKGILYILFLPVGLIGISIYAVFGIFVFIYQFVRFIYLFFTGRNFKNELKEDIEARKIIDSNKPVENKEEAPALSLYPSDSEMYKTDYVSPDFSSTKNEPEVEVEDEREEDSNE